MLLGVLNEPSFNFWEQFLCSFFLSDSSSYNVAFRLGVAAEFYKKLHNVLLHGDSSHSRGKKIVEFFQSVGGKYSISHFVSITCTRRAYKPIPKREPFYIREIGNI